MDTVDASTRGGNGEKPKPAFDELVLPEGHKDLILSLVTQHFRNKETSHTDQVDIIRGKGSSPLDIELRRFLHRTADTK
jgi:hypothetical protein